LDKEYAGMVLQAWDEQVAVDKVSMSPARRGPAAGPSPEGGQADTGSPTDIFGSGERMMHGLPCETA
jgi:hypothetical protein